MPLEIMEGFPPTAQNQVSLANWRQSPFNKWSFSHVREIIPSADIPNDPDGIAHVPVQPIDLRHVSIDGSKERLSLEDFLKSTDTDGLVVMHRGAIVFEHYASGMDAHTPHILMSVSKSVLGLVVGALQGTGQIPVDRPVSTFVPEVASTAYGRATIRDLLDMRVGVLFDEDYAASDGLIIDYRKAQNWDPLAPGEADIDLRSFFRRMTARDGEDGARFHYVSPNTDLLGWVIERATGKRYADIVSEVLWRPIGASQSAYITIDKLGAPRCAGGLCCTARDLARLGQLFVTNGMVGARSVIPRAWLDDIVLQGDAGAWNDGDFTKYFPCKPMHYRSKWYVLRGEAPLVFGVGIFGQNLFVDLKRELVIAKFSSQEQALDVTLVEHTMKGVEAIRSAFD